MPKTQH